jgi:hypothetical protein
MVKIGVRTDDPTSGSPVLARNRTISTYFHNAENFGLAQIHIARIAENVARATDVEPHQLVLSLRAPGGDSKLLEEHLKEAKRVLGTFGNAATHRLFKNSDGSVDATLRVDTNGDFRETLLNLGETTWPRRI